MIAFDNLRIGVIGLGYVGLPLAVEFARKFNVIGFDIDVGRITELQSGLDETLEITEAEMQEATGLTLSSSAQDLDDCNVYIVTVPTPIDDHKRPDLTALLSASETVARAISPGDVVIYESTVYPGATEERCVPLIEKISGLRFNTDFFAGYSPERINPGDRTHRLSTIVKVTSGSTPSTATFVNSLYSQIITAGTYPAQSIKVAEAAKVIENTQRDLNVALVNELAIIFDRLGIDTGEVLDAAGTKWNFLPFRPGLVGGHCIGVDPYYLTHKAEEVGYYPQIILAGRRLNDGMGGYVAAKMIKEMIKQGIEIRKSKVLILGFTFKENCPDLRNTRVYDIVDELREFGIEVDIFDPWISAHATKHVKGQQIVSSPEKDVYDGVIVAVAHDAFVELGASGIRAFCKPTHVLFDVKGVFTITETDLRL